jgi:hypothetical protein
LRRALGKLELALVLVFLLTTPCRQLVELLLELPSLDTVPSSLLTETLLFRVLDVTGVTAGLLTGVVPFFLVFDLFLVIFVIVVSIRSPRRSTEVERTTEVVLEGEPLA